MIDLPHVSIRLSRIFWTFAGGRDAVCKGRLLFFRYLTPRVFSEYWFEKGIFTWGWATASVATGIALLRIVDPKLESRTLEDFGVAYLGLVPAEIAVATFAPFILAFGFAWAFIGGSVIVGVGVLVLAWVMGWMVTPSSQRRAG